MNAWLLTAALCFSPPYEGGAGGVACTLLDYHGTEWRLAERREPVVVLVFFGCDCPLAKLYAPRLAELHTAYKERGVAFAAINANAHEGLSDLARFARTHQTPFPILKDPGARLADQLGVQRVPAVIVLDKDRRVCYRGRIDDQYTVNGHRQAPSRRDLTIALDELLAGKPVSVSETEVSGCLISRQMSDAKSAAVTYCREVAPILNRHCVVCHRSGQIAPFALTGYKDSAAWADNILEVVREGRMPPWSADPKHGRFSNDPSLTSLEKKTLEAWVAGGCPEGNRADLPPAPEFPGEWSLGEPDLIVEMPRPFNVPADGVIEYQCFEVDPGFQRDTWVQAAEVLPGNRKVVHHCTVFLKPPGAKEVYEQGRLGSYCLAAMALGSPPLRLPPGTAKLVPAGWRLEFVIHYTPIGSPQTDRTRLGLWLADPSDVRREVATKLMFDPQLEIPPHAAAHEVRQTWSVHDDVLVYALFPHMHLRGRSFRYEVEYADGTVATLLSVPRYDFNWQHRYELAEPRRIPKGSRIRCIAVYDNSAANPNNPDPSATVHAGPQSWDEMFNGYWDIALADQDLTRPPTFEERLFTLGHWLGRPLVLAVIFAGALGVLRAARWWRGQVGRTPATVPNQQGAR